MNYFKKGSLVPRRLGILFSEKKKAQHFLVFGTNAVWDGKCLTSANPMKSGESLIKVSCGMSAPRKNGSRQRSGFYISNDWAMHSYRDSETELFGAKFIKKEERRLIQ